MTEDMLERFINNGGIEKIGHAAYALLSFLVNKAKQQNYPKKIEISVRESMYKARIRSHQHLAYARKILEKEHCIYGYEPKGDTGFYFLDYNSMSK